MGMLDQLLEASGAPAYVTRDSGIRESYDSGMVRDTQQGKPRFDLLMVESVPYGHQFLTRLAALAARGAVKYGERNFERADSEEEIGRFKASAFRHFVQWMAGETDEDHGAAVAWNILAAETATFKLLRAARSREIISG